MELSVTLVKLRDKSAYAPDCNFTHGKKGAIVGHLEEICGGKKERRTFLRSVYGVLSSRDLEPWQWNALWRWLGPPIEFGGKWYPHPECEPETRALLRAALIEAGQVEMGLFDKSVT